MGQTLTHGIYLPDEGERNCYSGLAANWQILDNSVGTIAEHTSQIAGKAPAVHTHTISQITDFPAYGNAAGTICEGNDSRLSDARTPVAHTHVTADVTDLLNTAHEWTKEQVCDEGFAAKSTTIERCVTPDTIKHINFTFKDKNNKGIGAVRRYFRSNGVQELQIFGNTKIKDGQYDETGSDVFFGFSESIKPDGTKTFTFDGYMGSNLEPLSANQSIGSASYQWNSVYSKGYYYNGVAWGLDKANVWTSNNTFKNTEYQIGETPAATRETLINFTDKNNANIGLIKRIMETSGTSSVEVMVYNKFTNSQPDTAGTVDYAMMKLGLTSSQTRFCEIMGHTYPRNNNTYDLGTSTNKWKTLNGINPGALSLPDMGNVENTNYFDFSGSITHLDGTFNFYRPTVDGWMTVIIAGTSLSLFVDAATNQAKNQGAAISGSPIDGYCYATIPVRKDIRVRIQATGTSIYMAFVRPNLGNV